MLLSVDATEHGERVQPDQASWRLRAKVIIGHSESTDLSEKKKSKKNVAKRMNGLRLTDGHDGLVCFPEPSRRWSASTLPTSD
jgi:hypothetical protein